MNAYTYTAILGHDNGKKRLTIGSFYGEESAIQAIMAIEHCPRCAILKIKKNKKV